MKLHTKIISLSGAGLLLVLLAIFIRPGADEAVPAAVANHNLSESQRH